MADDKPSALAALLAAAQEPPERTSLIADILKRYTPGPDTWPRSTFRREGERLAASGNEPLKTQAYNAGRDVPLYGPLQDAIYASQWEDKPLASWEVGGNLGRAALDVIGAYALGNGIRAGAPLIERGMRARDMYNTGRWDSGQTAKHQLQRLGFGAAASYPPRAIHDALSSPSKDTESGFDLEKAVRDKAGRDKWGPDMPWTLPESMIGDVPYRYQGIVLHSLLAALSARASPPTALGNLGYVGYSLSTGRTQRPRMGEDGIPPLPDAPY